MKKALLFLILVALSLVAVAGARETNYVIVTLVSQSPDPVEPADQVELRFRFENNGTGTVFPIEVELLPQYPFAIYEEAVKDIGSIDARQSGQDAVFVKYRVRVDGNADEGLHDIYVRYRIGNANWVRAGPFQVNVEPVVAVIGVESAKSGSDFRAGDAEEFSIVLHNTGKSVVRDLRAKVNLNSVPFAPVGSSNEKVVGNLAPGEKATASFLLMADSDAESGNYKTELVLDFFDDSGRSYARNSTIGLVVNNAPEYSIALKETEVASPGSSGEVVISISNTGPSRIRFMTLRLLDAPGYRVLSAPEVYLGNLEADDFETAEFGIRANENGAGRIDLEAVLTYKDGFNREIVRREAIPLQLYSKSDAARFGLAESGQNLAVTFLTISIQLIFGVFVIFMLIDCWKNSFAKYRKVLWSVVILTGIGAVLYYFIARRKR